MTTIKKNSAPKRAGAAAERTPNPFLDSELHARMRDYTEREAAIAKELRAIAQRGAGKLSRDPRYAPSLGSVLPMIKKGLPLADMFARMAAGTEKGLWEPWMTVFGFELLAVNYAPTGPRNARLALDLGVGSKANAVFAKAGIANWRSLVAEDCAEVQIESASDNTHVKACAVFCLDPKSP